MRDENGVCPADNEAEHGYRAVEWVRHLDADAAAHRDRVVADQVANGRRLFGGRNEGVPH
jgi:hypothetical protein